MAFIILLNGNRIPITRIGADCGFNLDTGGGVGGGGDTIVDFRIENDTELVIETDVGGPWMVDIASLLVANMLLPVNTDSFNIQAGYHNLLPGGPTVIYSLPDPSLSLPGTLIGMKSPVSNSLDVVGGGTIDGALSFDIQAGQSVLFTSDGSNWEIVSDYIEGGDDIFLVAGQMAREGDNQTLSLELNDSTYVDVDLRPAFLEPVVLVANYSSAPSVGADLLPHQTNLIRAEFGRVYLDIPDPDVPRVAPYDVDGFVAGTVIKLHRSGHYPVVLNGRFTGINDTYVNGHMTQYPVRGSDLELVATLFTGEWLWLVREFAPQLTEDTVMLDTPPHSFVALGSEVALTTTPEAGNKAVLDYRRGQEIATRIPTLFTQPLAAGTQIFLSTSLSPVEGADVPYVQGEPYDSSYPNMYVGHLVRPAGSELSPPGTNYTVWLSERENWIIRLNDERDYITKQPSIVRLVDGLTTWFRLPNSVPAGTLTNISDLADDIEANSTDLVSVQFIYYYDSVGTLQLYDHTVPFGDAAVTAVSGQIYGVRASISSGRADYRRRP